MSGYYMLVGKKPVPCDLMTWATLRSTANRHVAISEFEWGKVSTVFLGLDHQWFDGPPLLFETMIFGGPLDQEMDRYSTWEEAEAGHKAMVEKAIAAASV